MSDAPRQTTPNRDRVGLGERFALGAGGCRCSSAWRPSELATPFYQMTPQAGPGVAGAALTVPRFLDAFIDPIVGRSPTTSTRASAGGARSSRSGAIVQALASHDLDGARRNWGQIPLTAWLSSPRSSSTSATTSSRPLLALQYEITSDYDEARGCRPSSGLRKAARSPTTTSSPSQLDLFVSVITGVRTLGWIVGLVFLGLVGLLPALFVRERYFHQDGKQATVAAASRIAAAFTSAPSHPRRADPPADRRRDVRKQSRPLHFVYFLFDGTWPQAKLEGQSLRRLCDRRHALDLSGHVAGAASRRRRRLKAVALVFAGRGASGSSTHRGTSGRSLFDPLALRAGVDRDHVLTPAMLADICDEESCASACGREGRVRGDLFVDPEWDITVLRCISLAQAHRLRRRARW